MKGLFGNTDNDKKNRIFKIGEVSSVNPDNCTARVVFSDEDGLVSYDLPVMQRNTIANKDYAMPEVKEDVLCVFLPDGPEDGFILGSFYAGDIEPPETDSNKRTVVFADGTKISYDRTTHTLTATIGDTSIMADQSNVNVVCAGTADIQAGTVNATADTATVTASTINLTGDVTISGKLSVSGDVTAQSNITATGNITTTGAVTATGDVIAMGKTSLSTHTHTDSLNKPTSVPV